MAGDRYQVDIASVRSLIRAWQNGTEDLSTLSKRLLEVHGRLTGCVPSALVEGALGELPLAECFAKVAAAASASERAAQGLAQDVASLEANLAAYVATEASVEAKLRSIEERHGGREPGRGSSHAPGAPGRHGSAHAPSPGHRRGSTHRGPSSGGKPGPAGGVRPPGPAHYANQAQLERWIDQAFRILEAAGMPARELDEAGVLLIIEHESSGNPNAINNWDSNARAGDPSRGLMQVIGTTFDAYKLPGHGDIYDPVDNIIAGVRYAISRYGSIQNVPGVRSVNSGGSYVGY